MLVSNGSITIIDVNDGVNASLTQSSVIIPCQSDGTVILSGVGTTMKVYLGGIDDSANWNFYVSSISDGITYSDSRTNSLRLGVGATDGAINGTLGYIKITSFTANDSAYIFITAFKFGYAVLTKRIDVIKVKQGLRGSVSVQIKDQSIWSVATANAYFSLNFNNVKILGDIVTMYGFAFSETRVWDGSLWQIITQLVDGNLIVNGTVSNSAIAVGAIGTDQIKSSAITATKLADNSIVVGSAVIQNGAIINAMIGDATIDTAKIRSLSASKITTGDIEVGQTLSSSSKYSDGTAKWSIAGDGTTNFTAGSFSGSLSGANITGATGVFSGTLSAGAVDLSTSFGTTTNYLTAAVYTLTVPTNVTSLRVNIIGGGGGGGGGGSSYLTGGGSGGSGAILTTITLSNITAGTSYTLKVGSGGAGGANFEYQYADSLYQEDYWYVPSNNIQGLSGESTTFALTENPSNIIASSIGGIGGVALNIDNPYLGATNTHLGTNGTGMGAGIAAMYLSGSDGINAYVNSGAGGGGGYGADAGFAPSDGGAGATGKAIIEFFNINSIVLRNEMNTLKSELRNQNLVIS